MNYTNYNSIQLNHQEHLERINERSGENTFVCTISNETKEVFMKFSPLVEPAKYLIGKFDVSDTYMNNLPNLDNSSNEIKKVCPEKIVYDTNNIPYIDGFFSFLSSKLCENVDNFHNGLRYYGSFLGIKENFKINVYDDF